MLFLHLGLWGSALFRIYVFLFRSISKACVVSVPGAGRGSMLTSCSRMSRARRMLRNCTKFSWAHTHCLETADIRDVVGLIGKLRGKPKAWETTQKTGKNCFKTMKKYPDFCVSTFRLHPLFCGPNKKTHPRDQFWVKWLKTNPIWIRLWGEETPHSKRWSDAQLKRWPSAGN